ncbi:MAG: ester cyclase [Chloroflexia bacterium]|nr:ester cyclase [Chloroflexia bacterium]
MATEANKAVFRVPFQALNERRLETLDAHPAFSGDRAFFERLFAAFPDATATLHELIGEKNWLAYRLTQPGTHQGEFMEIPATGRRAEWDVIGTVRVDDGKFVEHHAHPDTISLMQQLGAAPPAAPASRAG